MAGTLDTSGIDRLIRRFEKIANPNVTDLFITVGQHMDDDNRRGVLAGTDGEGRPMAPVTYRPARPGSKPVKLTVEQRLGQKPGMRKGRPSRIGSGVERNNNNLTTAEYRLLGGPPLAPRKQFSRVITNYAQSREVEIRKGVWEMIGGWRDVLSTKGVPFLTYHFNGVGQKRRDLRGLRPEGMARIKRSLKAWMISMIQSHDV